MIVSPILRGGVGNCLFGMATAYSYCLKHNADYSFPIYVESPHNDWNPVMNFRNLDYMWVKKHELKGNIQTYKEPFFHYQEIPKYDCDYLFLDGYFQSHLYFNDHRTQILRLLNIPYEYKEGWTFIHYRLGDYKILTDCHEIVSDEYLKTAMDYFIQKGFKKFFIFSDEIYSAAKVIEKLQYEKDLELVYSVGQTEIVDLSLMSSCQNGIMSASAYSWWGAWLGQNKDRLIVYPKKWFAEKLSYHNTTDLCPETWVRI